MLRLRGGVGAVGGGRFWELVHVEVWGRRELSTVLTMIHSVLSIKVVVRVLLGAMHSKAELERVAKFC